MKFWLRDTVLKINKYLWLVPVQYLWLVVGTFYRYLLWAQHSARCFVHNNKHDSCEVMLMRYTSMKQITEHNHNKCSENYWVLWDHVSGNLIPASLGVREGPPQKKKHLKWDLGTSLVAQWLRICLPMPGTRVQSLVREDPTWRGATKPVCHNYWACTLEPVSHNYWACMPQLLKPACLEPVLRNKRSHCNEKATYHNEE